MGTDSTRFENDEIARLRVTFGKIARRVDRRSSGEDGLTRTQFSLLSTVARHEEIGVREVAEIEGLNPTMLSRMLGKLEDAGLLTRSPPDPPATNAWSGPASPTRPGTVPASTGGSDRALRGESGGVVRRAQRRDPPGAPPRTRSPRREHGRRRVSPVTALTDLRGQTFAALRGANFRRYISGQAVSLIGTWMQTVAQSWLVLELTGSGTAIGVVLALQTVPMLLIGPYGGVVADRVDKRRLMIGLQSMMGIQALVLGLLTVTGTVRLWHVWVLAVMLGLNQCFENPPASRSCSRWSAPKICAMP